MAVGICRPVAHTRRVRDDGKGIRNRHACGWPILRESNMGSSSLCTWIEAGSNSSVTSTIRRCLSFRYGLNHLFCRINPGWDDAIDALAESTANLWKHGHHVQFWVFHRNQKGDYQHLSLPPYQFEKTQLFPGWPLSGYSQHTDITQLRTGVYADDHKRLL